MRQLIFVAVFGAVLLAGSSVNAQCPIVKTEIESWDLSVWDGVSMIHRNNSENTAWNVTMCQFVFSSTFEWGNFEGTPRSVQFHEPSDTFYMYYQNGDKGEGCMPDGRQTDLFFHCNGCPPDMSQCDSEGGPCVCAAWDDNCVAEVHVAGECPVGVPKYREGFDIFDASTGINVDVSKVVVKDGEVLASWRDQQGPSVANNRAVIPKSVSKAVFFLMMSEKSTESTDFDPPDVFTDQSQILQITVDGNAAHGGTVTPEQMQDVVLHFHCLQAGLANVHVEISFGGKFYPCDFAFTYECAAAPGHSSSVAFFFLIALISLGCVLGGAYNYKTQGRTGVDAIPFIDSLRVGFAMLVSILQEAIAFISSKISSLQGGGGGGGGSSSFSRGYDPVPSSSQASRGFQEDDDNIGII